MSPTTTVFDCRRVAQKFHDWVVAEEQTLRAKPVLATVHFAPRGDDGSRQYRELIHKDAARLGVDAQDHEAGDDSELLSLITRLNADPSVTGIMVFYPIGGKRPDEDVMDLVSPLKDVEGLHSVNLGYLIKFKQFLDEAQKVKCVVPATAKAVVKTLQDFAVPIEKRFVTIVNNSMRVGKPLGLMLENLGATVVKCYDRTRREDLEKALRMSDIVITAVPDPEFKLQPSWVKAGAAVVDVSYQGNVDVSALREPAYMTVPDNRIGQVTRAMMFVNLIYCARAQAALR